jgi:acetylornithine/succinyldiaminopimelate/putrescine aminotransferase
VLASWGHIFEKQSKDQSEMKLLTLEESYNQNMKEANKLFATHMNPTLLGIYQALGVADLDIKGASGVEITLTDGRTILDFSGSIGILGVGHNHPRIVAAEKFCHEKQVIDAIKLSPHKLESALAYNLAQMLPGDLEVSFFAVSGGEAVEAAMKICEKAQGPEKTKFITLSRAFHGKTHGSLSLTVSGTYQNGYLHGIPKENVLVAEYGDLESLEKVITESYVDGKHPIIALAVEALQGEGLMKTPDGYLKGAVELCKKHKILTIFDEVKTGMGRTGRFCAFQREEGVVPDVVTLAKAIGGGKRAMGAMVSTQEVFKRAYGKRKEAVAHSSSFSGLGETCAVAIETLNIYNDEKLTEGAKEKGDYLREKLLKLQEKYPKKIIELRGEGLLQGIRFDFNRGLSLFDKAKLGVFQTIDSAYMASTVRELVSRYNILCHFSAGAPDVLHVMPPLVVTKEQLDTFVDAIDDILSRGFVAIVTQFIKGNVIDKMARIKG